MEAALFLMLAGYALWMLQNKASSQSPAGSSGYGYNYGFFGNYGTAPVNTSGYGDVGTLARTIYGEARNQTQSAMQGVASVVLNRLRQGFAGGSIAGVCTQRNQFDCWNSNDPNFAVITDPNVVNDPVYQTCVRIAQNAVAGNLPDDTYGAVFYFSPPIISPPSGWGSVAFTTKIDELSFYKTATGVA